MNWLLSLRIRLLMAGTLLCVSLNAQDIDSLMAALGNEQAALPVLATFKTSRLVNLNTTEQVKRNELDFKISHRFDDVAGSAGGITTFYGFDNVTDIRLAFDYGISDRWVIGIGRSKGAHLRRQVVDLNSRIKVLRQTHDGSMPVSLSVFLSAEIATMLSSSDTLSPAYFGKKPWHRINYVSQILIARKFGANLSMELAPTLVHRNLVHYSQKNDCFALGLGLRYKFTRRLGVIVDSYYTFDPGVPAGTGMNFPLGLGMEIETGGHVFQLVFSNNKSLLESQFLTENQDTWLKGQFRLGFFISRVFALSRKK